MFLLLNQSLSLDTYLGFVYSVDIFQGSIIPVQSAVLIAMLFPQIITHLAKSKCKLAIYTKVDWTRAPPLLTKGTLPVDASAL